ncbi:MAG: murein hydrolase activator EnvC family protein, partial [Methyloligellaceae bacterium]
MSDGGYQDPGQGRPHFNGGNILLAPLLALTLLSPVPLSLAQENLTKEDAARQLEERRRELERTRQQEQTLSRDLDALAKERATLNEQLIATASRIQTSEKKLSEIEERLGQYSEQETMVRGSIEQRRATIAKLLGAMQRIGKEPPPAVVARRDDALEMVRSAMLMASIYPELNFQANSLGDDLKDLVRLTDGIRREQAAERQEAAKLEQEQFRIAGLLEEKKSRLARGQNELAQIRDAAKRHASEVTYLGDLLERMKKELAKAKSGFAQYEKEQADLRRRQAEQQAAPATKPEKKKRLALLSPGRIKPGIPFAKAKGTLPHPVQGQLLVSFGDAQRVGGRSQGIW